MNIGYDYPEVYELLEYHDYTILIRLRGGLKGGSFWLIILDIMSLIILIIHEKETNYRSSIICDA
jgi:hypothetical protein